MEKFSGLCGIMRGMGSVVLAYSGGLDSSFVLKAAADSGVRVLAVTSRSETTPARDLRDAVSLGRELGVGHRVIDSAEMQEARFTRNPPDRCYHCKDILFAALWEIARAEGYACVADGANMGDLGDYRPGLRAAAEHGVRHPLIEAGYGKAEVRAAARAMGLSVWDKPASPCLSSRFPYGVAITREALLRVARAEDFLRSLGIAELRVRDHGGLARVEVPLEVVPAVIESRERIAAALRAMGYDFVSLDLEGLRSGGLNRVLG